MINTPIQNTFFLACIFVVVLSLTFGGYFLIAQRFDDVLNKIDKERFEPTFSTVVNSDGVPQMKFNGWKQNP